MPVPRVSKKPAERGAANRVPVPCYVCGEPTAMRVAKTLLERVHIWHICKPCDRRTEAEAATEAPTDASAQGV